MVELVIGARITNSMLIICVKEAPQTERKNRAKKNFESVAMCFFFFLVDGHKNIYIRSTQHTHIRYIL